MFLLFVSATRAQVCSYPAYQQPELRCFLTLRISNQSSGVFLLCVSATRAQVCSYSAYRQPELRCVLTLRISNQSSGLFILCVSATRAQVCSYSAYRQPELRCVLTLRISNQSSGVFLLCVSATRAQVCSYSAYQQPELRFVHTLRISNQSSGVFLLCVSATRAQVCSYSAYQQPELRCDVCSYSSDQQPELRWGHGERQLLWKQHNKYRIQIIIINRNKAKGREKFWIWHFCLGNCELSALRTDPVPFLLSRSLSLRPFACALLIIRTFKLFSFWFIEHNNAVFQITTTLLMSSLTTPHPPLADLDTMILDR